MKMKNRSHRYDKNRPRPRPGHECKWKSVTVWWCLYVLSNT